MKTIALIFLLSISQLFAQQQSKNLIELSFTNQKSATGKIFLAIYDNEKSFGTPEKAVFLKTFPAKIPFLESFELKSEEYAFAVFQDLNENGKLDKNWVGIPIEPYGFSNDPVIRFGPPSFNDCLLKLSRQIKVNIKLH
jgi:uncharacterized protein (DUF2141 family)